MLKMYGMFSFNYDYYEWENLCIISRDKDKLIAYYQDMETKCDICDLTNLSGIDHHKALADRETTHFGIRQLEII